MVLSLRVPVKKQIYPQKGGYGSLKERKYDDGVPNGRSERKKTLTETQGWETTGVSVRMFGVIRCLLLHLLCLTVFQESEDCDRGGTPYQRPSEKFEKSRRK